MAKIHRKNCISYKLCDCGGAEMTDAASFVPLHTRVLIKPMEAEPCYKGTIVIPDKAKESPLIGLVVAVGKGRTDKFGKVFPLDVKPGDHVLYGKYSGSEISIDGETYRIMVEEEILGTPCLR